MIIRRRLFSSWILPQKLRFAQNIKSATGLANKNLARSSKQLASEMYNISGKPINSYKA